MKVKVKAKIAQLCSTLCNPMDYSAWNSPDQNMGVCSFSLLQRIFPTQGSNRGLLYCRWILYQLSHKRRPRIYAPIYLYKYHLVVSGFYKFK